MSAESAPGPSLGPALRLGLLLDETSASAGVASLLHRIVAEGLAELALVILAPVGTSTRGAGYRTPVRAAGPHGDLAQMLYARVDQRRYGAGDHPDRPVDLSSLLDGIPALRLEPDGTIADNTTHVADGSPAHVPAVDAVLWFGTQPPSDAVRRIARDGVWALTTDSGAVLQDSLAGMSEVLARDPTTSVVLVRWAGADGPHEVLDRSRASTHPVSPTVNRRGLYWQATALVVARLRRLAMERARVDADPSPASARPEPARGALRVEPRTHRLVQQVGRLAGRLVAAKARAVLTREQWFIAYARHGADGDAPVLDGLDRFVQLHPPADRYWADPFPVSEGGRLYLFFEEHLYAEPNAHLSVLEIDAEGRVGEPRMVLRRPYHLSYPAVFAWDGHWYMTPETGDQRRVELYRATAFPEGWERVGDLLHDVDAVDSTIALIDGRWWMFVGIIVPGAAEATALHLYAAPTPLGPWTPHRGNPVKLDVRGGRPGGRVFERAGRYYRVGQDGAPRYGSGLRVYEIDRLDDDAYAEHEVAALTPSWQRGLTGLHTLNASGGLTAIDVRRTRRRS